MQEANGIKTEVANWKKKRCKLIERQTQWANWNNNAIGKSKEIRKMLIENNAGKKLKEKRWKQIKRRTQ